MMNWISNFRRRSAIKNYARKLGPQLTARYGRSEAYTADQIKRAVEPARLPTAYICYGFAMYMGRNDFDSLYRELGQSCDYEAMRQDVANLCFGRDSNFSIDQAIAYSGVAGGAYGASETTGIDAGVDGGGGGE